MNDRSWIARQSPPVAGEHPSSTLVLVIQLVGQFQGGSAITEYVPDVCSSRCRAGVHAQSVVVYRVVRRRIGVEELGPRALDGRGIGVRAVERTVRRHIPRQDCVRSVLRHHGAHVLSSNARPV